MISKSKHFNLPALYCQPQFYFTIENPDYVELKIKRYLDLRLIQINLTY